MNAKVQGSRRTPYALTMRITTLKSQAWPYVLERMCEEARFAAGLLRGEMAEDIEGACAQAGFSLFPASLREPQTECSCPDWSSPCKHVAAVYYLIGEEFDRDPVLLFALRGLSRDALIAQLHGRQRTPTRRAKRARQSERSKSPAKGAMPSASLFPDARAFWGESVPAREASSGAAAERALLVLAAEPAGDETDPRAEVLSLYRFGPLPKARAAVVARRQDDNGADRRTRLRTPRRGN